ncbi:MAG: helix-turn-helix domain-containing protein [Clostridia bacterium]|nr:helix-turn-helix domain-containing protein [Clostridia bacterium]
MFFPVFTELCEERGVSPTRASIELGISRGSVSYWRKNYKAGIDAKPDMHTAQKIADYFGVSVDYLLGRAPRQLAPNLAPADLDRKVVLINVYGTIPAGTPMTAIEDILGTEEIPAAWLTGGKEYFALVVKGDSMYPAYLDGDIIIIRRQEVCETGQDCVVYVNGDDATLKRVYLYPDGSVELRPLNTNYAPRRYSNEEAAHLPITIGGVVVELRRRIGV